MIATPQGGAVSMGQLSVRRGTTTRAVTSEAVADLCAQIVQPDMSLAIVFASPHHDLDVLGGALAERFACPVLACTTAGEIASGPGYVTGSLTGATVASPDLSVCTSFVPSVDQFVRSGGSELAQGWTGGGPFSFALLLVDGLALLEDPVAAFVHARCAGATTVGGSAGDGLDFRRTFVYHDGAFHRGAALVAGVRTTLPFTTFLLQHFQPTEHRLVITGGDAATRTVFEINGEPAGAEYARSVGVTARELTPQVFAAHPVMLRVGGQWYVRSIQKVNPDGSLSFFCAIDTGVVLRVARPTDLVASLRDHLAATARALPTLQLILGFDCVLRRLEIEQRGEQDRVREVLAPYPFVGASTYGEQIDGLHVNHTLTGLALGA